MPSTPSSDPSGDDTSPRPSRAAIALLVLLSLAIPAGVLGLILAGDTDGPSSSTATTAPVDGVAPIDTRQAVVGTPAPGFTLKSTTGDTVSLSSRRGHPVVVVFFASWCHPCEEELPVLEQFARDDDRLRVIAVNFRDLSSDSVAFIERLGVTFPALLDDPSAPVAASYGVRGIPQTIFVDAKGIVRGRVYGETSHKALEPAIDDLLAGRDIRPI